MEFLEVLEQISIYLGQLVQRYGSLGIAAAMFAESAGVPFASAVVILTSGTMIFSGKVSFWSIFLSSTGGITLGSIFSYMIGYFSSYMGRLIKKSFLQRQRKMPDKPHPYRRSRIYMLWERYGSFSIFMGQFWGVTRTFISFPAGAMHMNILLFIIYTSLGGAIFSLFAIGFSIILTGAAGLLLKYFRLFLSLPPWFWGVFILVLVGLIYLYRRLGLKFSLIPLWQRGREWFLRNRQ
jgi:membrane protein DedA with SNARE-associated domain